MVVVGTEQLRTGQFIAVHMQGSFDEQVTGECLVVIQTKSKQRGLYLLSIPSQDPQLKR